MLAPTVDELLDQAPLTALHIRVWLLSSMGVMLDGFDFFIVGVAVPLIRVQYRASSWEIGLISAAAVIGAIIGASTLGVVTDRLGRRIVFMVDLAMFVFCALGCALAWSVWSLIFFRFILGVCIGADYPLAAAYLAEIAPAKSRSRLLVGAFSMQALGQVFGALTGLLILKISPDLGAWRWMFAAGIPPAVIVVILRLGVPESPRWLASKGRLEEAAAVTARFVRHAVDPSQMAGHVVERKVGFGELFAPTMRRRTILATVPWFLMDIATYGVGVFTPTILAALAFASTGTNFLANDIVSTQGAAALDIFLVVGFGLAIVLIARVGRTRLQVLGFAVMTASLVALATASWLPGGGDQHLILVFGGFACFNVFMNMGPNSTTFLIPAEIFPTQIRATAHGFATSCGKMGAAVGLLLFPVMESGLGLSTTLVVIAGGCLVGGLVTEWFRNDAPHHELRVLPAAVISEA